MSDIVEQLRKENSVQLAFGNDLSDVLLDAALEIERLQEALTSLLNIVDWANSALARGDDEQWIHHNLMKAAGKAREAIEQ
jgi:hypothetical protein